MTRRHSGLTVTDVFCGAGGNTIGAKKAGLTVRVALNHWERAMETYRTNNPEVAQAQRVDVSLSDPRRYYSTDIAIMSPECTTHSPAGGNRHRGSQQPDLFNKKIDPATERSRVTMLDVVRFTEYHRYEIIVIENVVEVTRWELFEDWLRMMLNLGYHHRILSLNSMFFWPTPQSRDRVYVVFWKKGNRAPDLNFCPLAPCPEHGHINAVQSWKNGNTIGKYKRQYVYTCPRCRREVTPFYFAALNAIDFTLPAQRIGDRTKPLRPRTMERIAFGLKKYGGRQLIVQTNMTSRLASRVRSSEEAMPTQPASVHHAVVDRAPPFVVNVQGDAKREGGAYGVDDPLAAQLAECAHDAVIGMMPNFLVSGQMNRRVYESDQPLSTIAASRVHESIVTLPGFVVQTCHTKGEQRKPHELDGTLPAMGAQQSSALVLRTLPFIAPIRTNGRPASVAESMATIAAGGNHHLLVQDGETPAPFVVARQGGFGDAVAQDGPIPALTTAEGQHAVVQGAALLSLRDSNAMHVADLSEEMRTQTATYTQSALIATGAAPFLASYYGTQNTAPVDEGVPTITAKERHALVTPESILVEDCYFRMLQPHEIGLAMAFEATYQVGGTKRERVKQYGNAVTPPVMNWIIRQCSASLAPEVADDERFGVREGVGAA